jgi:vacuolar protein sorting-associated protein 13A/C
VTFRSIYGVENLSLYPLELTLVNEVGQPVCSPEKLGKMLSLLSQLSHAYVIRIAPGQHYSLPIDMVTQSRVRIQPDRTAVIRAYRPFMS